MALALKKALDLLDGRSIPGLRAAVLVVSVMQTLMLAPLSRA